MPWAAKLASKARATRERRVFDAPTLRILHPSILILGALGEVFNASAE